MCLYKELLSCRMRKFLLKLKEREMAEQREREREIAAAAEAAGEEVHKVHEASTEEEGPLVILNYVERGPSEVLRAITRGIGRDDTAPEYKFHDDPYLIPYNSLRKREYIMAKDGGNRAARLEIFFRGGKGGGKCQLVTLTTLKRRPQVHLGQAP